MTGRSPHRSSLLNTEARSCVRVFRDTDAALEWCEDQLLAGARQDAEPKFALSELDVFKG